MNDASRRALGWAPRLLGIAFALFVSLFALDVFSEGLGIWGTVVALSIHLLPAFAVAIALVAAWRYEWAGGLLFPAVGVIFLYIGRGTLAKVVFAGIPFATAILFLASWTTRLHFRRH